MCSGESGGGRVCMIWGNRAQHWLSASQFSSSFLWPSPEASPSWGGWGTQTCRLQACLWHTAQTERNRLKRCLAFSNSLLAKRRSHWHPLLKLEDKGAACQPIFYLFLLADSPPPIPRRRGDPKCLRASLV